MSSPRDSAEASRLVVASKARLTWFRAQVQASPWLRTKAWATASAWRCPSASMRLHLAQKRRRIGEIVRRQIAAHLGFGMLAGRDAAEDLQHHRVVDDQRAVRLARPTAT